MTKRQNPRPNARFPRRAAAFISAAVCVPALIGGSAFAAEAPPIPAPIKVDITGLDIGRFEMELPTLKVPGEQAETSMAEFITFAFPQISEPVAPTLAATNAFKLTATDISRLIAAKHAEFPPAAEATIRAALANCTAAPAFSPDANWLDMAVAMITREEGFDATWKNLGDGMWTIGYGHAVPISEYPSPPGNVAVPLSAQGAAQLLHDDLANMDYIPAVNDWFVEELPPVVFATMVSYAYNTGPRGFAKYYIPTNDLEAIAEVISHASDHHAEQFPGLICRRAREAALIRSAIGSPRPEF